MSQHARNHPEQYHYHYQIPTTVMSNDYTDFIGPADWLSDCCGARCLGELHQEQGDVQASGICSDCHDHAAFEKTEE